MISIRTHNILDYVGAAVLILCPFLFGYADVVAARNVFVLGGFIWAIYSLLTNYEFSIVKLIPLGAHMVLDVLVGLFYILAPSLFSYRAFMTNWQYALHFIVGIGAIGLVAITKRNSETAS